MVVNGHYPGEGRRTDLNDCGQPVHQVLMDYQSRINGGDGWLRYFTFKPSENKIYAYHLLAEAQPVREWTRTASSSSTTT